MKEEVVLKAQKGDKEAFTSLVLEIKNDLYKIAKMRINSEDDIQDLIQETMIKAFKNIKQLKDPTRFKPWVIKILINNCNKMYNKKIKNKEISLDNIDYNIEFYKNDIIYNEDIKLKEDTLDFYNFIKDFKYEERMIIILYYSQRYTIKEISNILSMNENTIKTKLLRVKAKVKNNYKGGNKIG